MEGCVLRKVQYVCESRVCHAVTDLSHEAKVERYQYRCPDQKESNLDT